MDPATQKSSQTTWQKEEGSESRYRWTTPQAASIVSLAAHYRKYFSAYHKRPALMQPVCTAVSSPCHSRFIPLPHGPRPGRPSPRVNVSNDYGKTRLFTPIRSKTTRASAVCSPPQCAARTLMFSHAEVMNLLEKGAIEIVPPAQSESGFYSCYFPRPQKKMAACDLF